METSFKGRPDRSKEVEYPIGTDDAIIQRDLDEWGSEFIVVCRSHGIPNDFSSGYRRKPDASPKPGVTEYEFWFSRSGCPVCHVLAAGVDPWLANSSFENFEADTEELKHNLSKVREFAASPTGFLVLVGRPGTGKSHLAASVIRASGSGTYVRHLDLVDQLRASYQQQRRRNEDGDEEEDSRKSLNGAFNRWLLVIDELGVANCGNDAEVLLYKLLDHRVSHMKPTVLVSNVPASEFARNWGERIADRIRLATFAVLSFTGQSRRSSLNAAYLKRAKARF